MRRLAPSRLRLRAAAAALAVAAAPVATLPLTARPAVAQSASAPASAVNFALAQIGKPYEWGAEGPSSYDCSGLTWAAYRAAGYTLPRVSRDQYGAGPHVPIASLRPGDLIFYATNTADPTTIHHVGMYLGGGNAVFAPHTGTVVQIESIFWSGLMPYGTRPAPSSHTMLDVQYGEADAATAAVQRRLNANGYHVSVDGGFGPITKSMVRSFQSANGLLVDGIVGPKTWGALVTHGAMTTPNAGSTATGAGIAGSGVSATPTGLPQHRIPVVPNLVERAARD